MSVVVLGNVKLSGMALRFVQPFHADPRNRCLIRATPCRSVNPSGIREREVHPDQVCNKNDGSIFSIFLGRLKPSGI